MSAVLNITFNRVVLRSLISLGPPQRELDEVNVGDVGRTASVAKLYSDIGGRHAISLSLLLRFLRLLVTS
jgi:hypothetical protein